MKVLFLDVDGVVNSAKSPMGDLFPIDPMAAFRVGKIELETGCKVVLSSSWKHRSEAVDIVSKKVTPIHDITPNVGESRGDEVKAWLDKHPEVEKYAILDDDDDFLPEQEPHFFQTKWEDGLTGEIMQKVIDHLGKE